MSKNVSKKSRTTKTSRPLRALDQRALAAVSGGVRWFPLTPKEQKDMQTLSSLARFMIGGF